MKITMCDVCGERAVVTYEIYEHSPGFRPLFGIHGQTPRLAGQLFDLCEEHGQPMTLLRSSNAKEEDK